MKFRYKLLSIKNLALLWCCVMVTVIVAKNKVEWLQIAQILSYAPLSYFVVNVGQDVINNMGGKEK